MKINTEALRAVKTALVEYEKTVQASAMTPQSKKTYLLHTNNFVRWLEDDFIPGASLTSRKPRNRQ